MEAVFHKHWKIPLKMQKCAKLPTFGLDKFLRPVLQNVHFAPQMGLLRDGFNAMCYFALEEY